MSSTTHSIKEALHALAEQLPADATWKDVAYKAYVRQEIEAGLAEAKRGEFAGDDEVSNTFTKWGVQRSRPDGPGMCLRLLICYRTFLV
jgi:predicted transcriptional regulator